MKIAAAIGFILFVVGLLIMFGSIDALLTKLELKDEAGEFVSMGTDAGRAAFGWLFS